uniref:Uncharacterized protein n=1 Tax=Glossina morsitans morsitans TaxID=37546 RepID=A0A1B0FHZ5_GLOMM
MSKTTYNKKEQTTKTFSQTLVGQQFITKFSSASPFCETISFSSKHKRIQKHTSIHACNKRYDDDDDDDDDDSIANNSLVFYELMF